MFQKIYTGTVNGHLFLGGAVAEEEPEEPVGHGRVVPVGRAAQSLQGAVGRVGHTGTTKTHGTQPRQRLEERLATEETHPVGDQLANK